MTAERNDIQLWLMQVEAPLPALLARWRICLDEQECARADRFYFDVDREIYIAAHWLLRYALSRAAPLAPEAWQFTTERYGKPSIAPALSSLGVTFNLSHTKGLVACAVGHGIEMGVDVERIAPERAELDIAERYFSADEVALMRAAPLAQRTQTFFRFWTLKEALIKATGEGLNRALDSFSFSFNPTAVRFHPDDPTEAARWRFIEDQPTPNHALAMAIRSGPPQTVVSVSRVHIENGEMTILEGTVR
ncbi:4'-phosphopantetheinyl transferase family protein [Bradyrhizobium sp. HKCCYLS1011]|uniref:4'-phosphopantetheinyl transferase family protein n=1 Tax=Bradyrhizobium sp. HKCCYLS1011 TaxID=3420733 RepID=UPI003EBC4099